MDGMVSVHAVKPDAGLVLHFKALTAFNSGVMSSKFRLSKS
jgi:hypothetical protein